MRIALVWTASVWKTTLVNEIEHNNKIYERPREIIKNWKSPADMNKEELIEFQRTVWEAQKKIEYQEHFLSDRSLICVLAYTKENSPEIYEELLEEFKTIKQYDILCYIPIETPLVQDGVRYEDETFRKKIDSNIKEILRELGIKYYIVHWDIEQRKKYLYNLIKFYG